MLEILNTILTTILLWGLYAFLAGFALICLGVVFTLSLYVIPWILIGLTVILVLSGEGLWALIPIFLFAVWSGIVSVLVKDIPPKPPR